jgi:hypothetical protein
VDTAGWGSGVRSVHGAGPRETTYNHGHQSHQASDPGVVALPAAVAVETGVAVVRSFTGVCNSVSGAARTAPGSA